MRFRGKQVFRFIPSSSNESEMDPPTLMHMARAARLRSQAYKRHCTRIPFMYRCDSLALCLEPPCLKTPYTRLPLRNRTIAGSNYCSRRSYRTVPCPPRLVPGYSIPREPQTG